jgi:hypothetical protein
MKLTPWFPGEVKPYRPGVYECQWRPIQFMGGRWFNEWDGKQWRYGCYSAKDHAHLFKRKHPVDHALVQRALLQWRGVRAAGNA